jgi:hypothetical protein
MPLSDQTLAMTAMMRKTAEAVKSSMYRLRKTAELLDASWSFLPHKRPVIGVKPRDSGTAANTK